MDAAALKEQEAYWRQYASVNNLDGDKWMDYMNAYFAEQTAAAAATATAAPPQLSEDELYQQQQEAYKIEQQEMAARLAEYNKHLELKANPDLAAKEEAAQQKASAGRKRKAEAVKADDPEAKKQKKESVNPHVWVTGLPEDVTPEELADIFKKCGVVKVDEETGEPRVRVYYDESGRGTGNALVTYYRVESVDLALQFLDGDNIRGHTIKVEKAVFSNIPKDAGTKAGDDKKKKNKKKKKIFDQTRDLAWDWSAEVGKHLPTVVVIKKVFVAKDFEDPNFYDELKEDLEPEFARFGEVERFTIFDTNEEGVVSVKYAEHEAAMECRKAMNGRFFAGRQLLAEFWDGKTNYKVEESDALREARLKAYGKYLEEEAAAVDGVGGAGGGGEEDGGSKKEDKKEADYEEDDDFYADVREDDEDEEGGLAAVLAQVKKEKELEGDDDDEDGGEAEAMEDANPLDVD